MDKRQERSKYRAAEKEILERKIYFHAGYRCNAAREDPLEWRDKREERGRGGGKLEIKKIRKRKKVRKGGGKRKDFF